MHQLLILYLTIAGGELLEQLPTYVSSNGTNDTKCLNGGVYHPCQTLGYVLTHTTKLQCTNCTIVVDYSHTVFPGHDNESHVKNVNITGMTSLLVRGVGVPLLDFEWFGLKLLVDNGNSTEVSIQNIHFTHCGSKHIHNYHCISLHLQYSLYHFSLTDFILSNCTEGINIPAVNVLYYRCTLECSWTLKVPSLAKFNYTIKNSSFATKNMKSKLFLSSFGTLDIEYCKFINICTGFFDYAVYIGIAGHSNMINVVIQYCVIQDNSFYGFLEIHPDSSSMHMGKVLINGNYFINNTCLLNHLIGGVYHIPIHKRHISLKLAISCTFNKFYSNKGALLHFTRLPLLTIANCSLKNNTVLEAGYIIFIRLYSPSSIMISNVKFINNTVSTKVGANKAAIVHIMLGKGKKRAPVLQDVTFTHNTGTSLALTKTILNVTGNLTFDSNTAITGGGLYIDKSVVYINGNAKIYFVNNYAIYGGAVYLEPATNICAWQSYNNSVIFSDNTATIRRSVFFASNKCFHSCSNVIDDITSLPVYIYISNSSVFPGQTLIHNITLIDCFNRNTSCVADVHFSCSDISCKKHGIYFSNQGLPQAVIHSGYVTSDIRINSKANPPPSIRPQITYTCKSPTTGISTALTTNITLLPCPIGFTFNAISKQCQCNIIAEVDKAFVCSEISGKACIRNGYWFGNVNGTFTVSKCIYSFCKYSNHQEPCPSDITSSDTTGYVLLSHLQNDQCQYGHGGTLCTGCKNGTTVTYGAVFCIPNHRCRQWHPYVLLFLNVLCPFVFGMFLIIVIQLKLSVGSGYLYGPLFYLAVLNLLPLDTLDTFTDIIHYFSATFVLKFEILGFIPWCFFPSVNLLYAKYFELLAPLVVSVAVLLTIYLARHVSRWFQYFQKSPIQGICVVIMMSFWSLASTSIQVITPVYLSRLNGIRVQLQPDLLYLHGAHVALWIISVIMLLFLLYLMIKLILSPFIHFTNLRIKPILDEFQSCYRDSMRWYGGVYFCYWIILQVMIITSNYLILQTLIILITVTHCLVQPYSQRWLNVMDGALLGCLAITSSLIVDDFDVHSSSYGNKRKFIIYMFTVLPLLFITVGAVWIILIRLGVAPIVIKAIKCGIMFIKHPIIRCLASFRNLQPAAQDNTNTRTIVERVSPDREPLLYYLQHSADYGAADNNY